MNDLEKLKKLADNQRQEKAKTEGKLETLYEDLGKEGFNSVDSAEGDMIILSKKISRMKKLFTSKLNEFKKKYAGEL